MAALMARELHDHYFREAKREGYRSRAAYKLIEIDDRRKVLRRGDVILDCGAAPGSWLQVAAQRVGPDGLVIGVDLKPIAGGLLGNVLTIEADLRELSRDRITDSLPTGQAPPDRAAIVFDVILSDMAPNTSGEHLIDHYASVRLCEAVLDRCRASLRLDDGGGSIVMKVLEGEAFPDLLQRVRSMFRTVKPFKPKASRDESTEMFIIATGFVGGSDDEREAGMPRKQPSSGWNA